MKLFLRIYGGLLLLAISTSLAHGIKCYVCGGCDTATGLQDCGTTVTQCMKMNNTGIILRACGTTGHPNNCTKEIISKGETETCFCDTDSCNGDIVASTTGPVSSTTTSMDGSTASTKNTTNAPSSSSSPPPSATTTSPTTTKKDRQSDSFKCYECEDCNAAGDLVSCPIGTTQCAKTTSGGLVSRSCGTTGMPDTCKSLKSTKETCYCSTDSCNGAGSLKGFTVVAITTITAFLTKIFM